jgi:hypothetical protein
MSTDLTDEQRKMLPKIEGLLNLAAAAGTPEEAASATAKAQELLTKYNLDTAMLEENGSAASAKREEAKVEGGLYSFQRDLWRAIEDCGRNLMGLNHFKNPKEAIKEVRENYRRDLWHDQHYVPEVWIEKQALEGVIGSICNELRVNFFSTKGYNSQSEQWRAGRRFASYYGKGQRPIVIHLGDHDPAGIDMTRDNRDRLSMFAGVDVQVIRLALNMEQIEQYNPPPNFAKEGDSKTPAYMLGA